MAKELPISSYSDAPSYPIETLEVHDEGGMAAAVTVAGGNLRSVPFSRRKAVMVSMVVATTAVLFTGAVSALFINREQKRQELASTPSVSNQNISFEGDATALPPSLAGGKPALYVNGDLVAQGDIKVVSGNFVSILRTESLTANQTLQLPNASGTVCLDINNCNFATQGQVNQQAELNVQQAAEIAQVQAQLGQIVIPPAGVTSLNGQNGAVTVQGSLNRVSVTTANGVLTLSTPQDLDANANVQFANLTLGASGQVTTNSLAHTGAGSNLGINAGTDTIVFTSGGRNFQLPAIGGASQTICTTTVGCGGGGSGVTDINSEVGSITLQGTSNQVSVATGSGVITLSTPQNINTTSSPTFAALTLTGLGSGNLRVSAGVLTVGAVNLATETTGTLAVANGGTGTGTAPSNGQLLIGNGGNYTLGSLGNNGGITVTSGAGSIGLAVNYGSLVNTAVQGNISLTCPSGTGNLAGGGNSITLGAGGSCNNISIVNNPTFSTSVTTPALVLTGAGSNGTLQVASLGQVTTYTLPDPGTSSVTICLSTGNCASAGGGITGAGTINRVAKFTAGGIIGNSTITDDGTDVSLTGDFSLQGGDATLGTTSQAGSLIISDGSSNTVTLQAAAHAANRVYTFPDVGANADVCLSTGNCGVSAPVNAEYLLVSLNGSLTNDRALAAGANITFTDAGANNNFTIATIQNPTFTTSVTTPLLTSTAALAITPGGALTVGSTTQTALLQGSITTVTSSAGNNIIINSGGSIELQDNTNVTGNVVATGNGTFQGGSLTVGATSQLGSLILNDGAAHTITVQPAVSAASRTYSLPDVGANADFCLSTGNCAGAGGGITGSGTINRVAKFTAGGAIGNSTITDDGTDVSLTGDITIQGGDATLGAAAQAGSLVVSDGSSNTVTLQVAAHGANRVYTFPDVGANADVCLSTGNCIGGGGGGAPSSAEYLVVSLNGSLSNERSLAAGSNISFTDAGANGTFTIQTVQNPTFTTSVTTPILQSAAALTLNSAAAGNIILNSAGTIELQDNTNVTGNVVATGTLTVQGASATVGTAAQAGSLVVFDGSSNTGTIQTAALGSDRIYTLPDEAGVFCMQGSTNCGFAPSVGGSYIAKNAADTSTASVLGNLLGLSNTNAGAAGVLSLSNSGTNSALSISQIANPGAGQAVISANIANGSPSGVLLDLQSNGISRFTVGSGGNMATLGNASVLGTYNTNTFTGSALTFGTNTAAVIQSAAQPTANAAGNDLLLNAGAANGSTTGNVGGHVSIIAGSSAGTGANNGGTTTIRGGLASGTGAGGSTFIQGGFASATAGSTGGSVAIAGANGSSTGTGGVGGSVTLDGGDAQGSGANNGGSIVLQGGSATGAGVAGAILLQSTGGNVGIGLSGAPAALLSVGGVAGNFQVDTAGNIATSGSYTQSGAGANTLTGTLVLTTLGAANTSTALCRNASNQVATCSAGVGSAYVQGGNAFTAMGVLGLTDNNALSVITNNVERLRVLANGDVRFNDSASNTLYVDAQNDRVGVGTGTPQRKLEVNGAAARIRIDSTFVANDSVGIELYNQGSTFRGGFIYNSASGNTDFYGSNATEALSITSSRQIVMPVLGTADTNTILCRNTSNQVATCSGSGTGASFVQSGNAFAATGVLGTTDNNGLQVITNSVGRLYVDTSNNMYLGNAGTAGTAASPNSFTLRGTGSATAGTAGGTLTVIGGSGATAGAGSIGGGLTLQGGSAGGSNIAGGTLTVAGGRGTGTAAGGNILFQIAAPGSSGSSNNALTTVGTISGTNGTVLLQPTADTTTAFNIKSSLGNNHFTLDTLNSRAGIALGAGNLPNTVLEVAGSIRISGITAGANNVDHFITPTGASVESAINIPLYDPGSVGQVLALGIPASTVFTNSRVLSIFDARTVAHQPSIGLFAPDENNIMGFSWDGANTTGYLKTTGNNIGIRSNSTDLATFTTTGISLLQDTTVTGNILPNAASTRDLGSTTLEFDELYVGDNNGIRLGLDQDATLAYDETTDDRVELAGSGASLFIEDRLGLGRQTFTMSTGGAATENLTPTASYVEVTGQDNNADVISLQTGSAKEGDTLIITNISATNDVSIAAAATTKVAGGANVLLNQYDVIMLIFDGTNWLQVSSSLTNQ